MIMYKYSIFEYKEFASCNFLGGDTNSFEVKITDSSELNLSYTKENFNNEILEYKLYSLPLRCIDEIKEVIKKNQEIFDINSLAPFISVTVSALEYNAGEKLSETTPLSIITIAIKRNFNFFISLLIVIIYHIKIFSPNKLQNIFKIRHFILKNSPLSCQIFI